MRYWTQLATEQFPPADLVRQAVETERWGFDGTCLSDHFQPWWEPGESAQAWTVLGAIGQATDSLPLGTGVTAPIYRSAFGPRAARIAARWGDGLWTLGDPEQTPELIDVYKGACEDAGKEPGEVILQVGFSWAEDDDTALAGATVWKATQPPEYYREDWSDPAEMQRKAQNEISDDEFKESYIVSSDPAVHTERVRELEKLGATIVCLQNGSGADPHGALRVYGEQVLPRLRA